MATPIGVATLPYALPPCPYGDQIGFNATQSLNYRTGDLKVGVLMVALPGYTAVGPTLVVGGGITVLGRDALPLAFVPVHLTVD